MFRRPWWLLLSALFGAAGGYLASDGVALHSQVANLSAPWLLVALLPALRCRTPVGGSAAGLLSTATALVAFYAVKTALLAGQNGGGGFLREFLVEASANRIYVLAGTLTGLACGALGPAIARRSGARAWLWLVGGMFAAETAVVRAVAGRRLAPPPLYFKWGVSDWRVYWSECAIGAGILAAALWRRRTAARAARPR